MKDVFVQLQTFEIVKALEKDLPRKIGLGFSSKKMQHRLVVILLALKDLGVVSSSDRGRERWFFFDLRENLSDHVIRFNLSEPEMVRSIELSKRIAPALKELWSRLVKSTSLEAGERQSKNFELDPFVSQLALGIDKEVVGERPQFEVLDLAERMARICLELQAKGVVIKEDTRDATLWLTAPKIDQRIGGAKVSRNARFALSSGGNAALLGQFHLAIRVHLKRRLTSILETVEAFFQLHNTGMMTIAAIDSAGHYYWDVTDEGRRVFGEETLE